MSQWQTFLEAEKQKTYFIELEQKVSLARESGKNIYPPEDKVFSAFDYADVEDIKVVILGQDPYHGYGQAHGLAFSVLPEIKIPPSLVNMYKELATDIEGFEIPGHGFLQSWAKQGVLLLNTVLTVEEAQAHSHAKFGWESFTDAVIRYIDESNGGCVFMLWGSHAQKKGKAINSDKHYVLKGPHPSPLSAYRGFFGCQHFSKANAWLESKGQEIIDWRID